MTCILAVMRGGGEVLTVVKEVMCLCVLRVVSARGFVWEDGLAGRFCMGVQKREEQRKIVWGEDQSALFTMGRLIVRGRGACE